MIFEFEKLTIRNKFDEFNGDSFVVENRISAAVLATSVFSITEFHNHGEEWKENEIYSMLIFTDGSTQPIAGSYSENILRWERALKNS